MNAGQRRSGLPNRRGRRPLLVAAVGVALIAAAWACWLVAAAQQRGADMAEAAEGQAAAGTVADRVEERFTAARQQMVDKQLRSRDITDPRVLKVMERVPRHHFVADNLQDMAYTDRPLPIESGQTISQPYIVALMTQLTQPKAEARALDVGTGCGYQAAVLAELCKEVYSIEIIDGLAKGARERLARLGYRNVQVKTGDGYRGWPEHAPFDLIIVAAAPDHIPPALVEQLAPGGRLVIPVGGFYQDLVVVEKQKDGKTRERTVTPVAFVPMTGEARKHQGQDRD